MLYMLIHMVPTVTKWKIQVTLLMWKTNAAIANAKEAAKGTDAMVALDMGPIDNF